MGVATALLSVVALAPDSASRFRWAALAGILMAGFAPVIADADTSGIPAFLRDYLVPGVWFSIFPWGAFLAFGLACGSMIPKIEQEAWGRVTQWGALCGFGLILLGIYCSQLPFSIYPSADFWVDSPALIACKMGTTLLLGAVAFLWTEYLSPGASFVRLLGTTSLAVYWVHIELVYGNSLWFFKERLMPWESVLACLAVITAMVVMSWAIHRYRATWREWVSVRTMGEPTQS
jgi:hypothetical protein